MFFASICSSTLNSIHKLCVTNNNSMDQEATVLYVHSHYHNSHYTVLSHFPNLSYNKILLIKIPLGLNIFLFFRNEKWRKWIWFIKAVRCHIAISSLSATIITVNINTLHNTTAGTNIRKPNSLASINQWGYIQQVYSCSILQQL